MRMLAAPTDWLRLSIGRALRSKVAGEDSANAAARIWGTPGPRWFEEADPVWRVHADASMFPGGIAALLLQSLHPSAMAGVAGHSGYKSDPWGRLQRTSHFIATTTYGTIADATQAIEVVKAVHHRVRGKDDRGVPYRADDPELLRWVHVAEAYSFLTAYQQFAPDPLTAQEADTYVAQGALVASKLGATKVPSTVRELEATLTAYRPVLRLTDAARESTKFLLREPPLPIGARPGYGLLAAGGISLLPTWARKELQLVTPTWATPGLRVLGGVGTGTVRWAMAGVRESEDHSALAQD